jgi:hypothetical protein
MAKSVKSLLNEQAAKVMAKNIAKMLIADENINPAFRQIIQDAMQCDISTMKVCKPTPIQMTELVTEACAEPVRYLVSALDSHGKKRSILVV